MRHELCPGCLSRQPLSPDGRFVVHGCDPVTHQFCNWAGRVAVDHRTRVNHAANAVARLYPEGPPKAGRRRRNRRRARGPQQQARTA